MSLLNIPFHNPAKPIIVFQLVNDCYPPDIHQMFTKTLSFMSGMGAHHIYRIVDCTHLSGSDQQISRLIETSFQKIPGSSIYDHRITPIGCGPDRIASLYHTILRSNPAYSHYSLPFFPTLHAALDFVRRL